MKRVNLFSKWLRRIKRAGNRMWGKCFWYVERLMECVCMLNYTLWNIFNYNYIWENNLKCFIYKFQKDYN